MFHAKSKCFTLLPQNILLQLVSIFLQTVMNALLAYVYWFEVDGFFRWFVLVAEDVFCNSSSAWINTKPYIKLSTRPASEVQIAHGLLGGGEKWNSEMKFTADVFPGQRCNWKLEIWYLYIMSWMLCLLWFYRGSFLIGVVEIIRLGLVCSDKLVWWKYSDLDWLVWTNCFR